MDYEARVGEACLAGFIVFVVVGFATGFEGKAALVAWVATSTVVWNIFRYLDKSGWPKSRD